LAASAGRFCKPATAIADRGGRVWTVDAVPHHVDGLEPVVLRSGDHVRRVREWWADDYHHLPGVDPA